MFRRRGSGELLLQHPVGSATKDPVLLRRSITEHLLQNGEAHTLASCSVALCSSSNMTKGSPSSTSSTCKTPQADFLEKAVHARAYIALSEPCHMLLQRCGDQQGRLQEAPPRGSCMQRPFNHFDSELGHRNSRVDRASTWKPCMKRECSVSVSISPTSAIRSQRQSQPSGQLSTS